MKKNSCKSLKIKGLTWITCCLALGAEACQSGPKSSKTAVPTKSGAVIYASSANLSRRAEVEAFGRRAIISTQGRAATQAARAILLQGGTVVDAAIAASFAISVERPHSTGLGGGGFMLIRDARSGRVDAVDFRERAPGRATPQMFLNSKGEVVENLSSDGILSVAVPGLVAGLAEIHHRRGHLPWARLLEPAIQLAEKGFPVYPALHAAMVEQKTELLKSPAAAAVYLKADGAPYALGEVLVQKDLGKTLRKIAALGKQAVYEGAVRDTILKVSQRLGGILSQKDFAAYRVKWREPVRSTYHGYELIGMPPPSSGGAHVLEILNTVENDDLKASGWGSPSSVHTVASAMQLAFADRAQWMGDPDFVSVPTQGIISKTYAQSQRARISPQKHFPSTEVQAGNPPSPVRGKEESNETTHFSIMDDAGNAVVSTQTINGYFGSSVVAPGTGIVLNDEMDDFSAKPGASNQSGAVGGDANAIAPGKTPLSSMSPTLVLKDGKPILAVGAPGGTRIINCVAQTILNFLEYQLPLFDSVAAVRFHHQWKPDELKIDAPGFGEKTENELKAMGYTLKVKNDAIGCRVMAVARTPQGLVGVSDPRDAGTAAGL